MTLDDNDVTYERVFREIRKQMGYHVLVENTHFDTKQRINIHFQDTPLNEVLNYLLKGTNLTYVINEKSIVFKEKSVIEKERDFFPEEVKVKQLNVRGRVTDATGAPLPGVNIIQKGTTNGTVTDLDGRYEIVVSEGATLVYSSVGYTTEEVVVGNETVVDIAMTMDIQALEQIVVIGYGVQEKRDLTGAASSISSEDMNQGAVTSPLQRISGKAAGVNITQIGNEPGVNPTVRIRGITSLQGGNDPLVVVDGIQGNMDLLNQVPPSEIESIDILKDASATAIYGSRGAPGVIIVTTKKSQAGAVTVEYHGAASVDFLSNKLDLLTADEWREQARIWNVPFSEDHGSSTDWYGLLTRPGTTHNHTVSFGGGSENFSYRASLSGILHEGVVINSSNNNYIARIQATQMALDDKLTLTVNLNNSIRQHVGSPGDVGRAAFRSNLISNAYVSRPTDPVLDENGDYYFDQNVFQYINPYAVAETIVNESEIHNQLGSFRADLEVTEGLTLGWFGSWRKVSGNSGYYAPARSTLPGAIDQEGIANVTINRTDERLMDISLGYDKAFGRHKINAIGVYEWQSQLYQGNFAQARGFVNDISTYNALQLGSSDAALPGDVSSYKNDRKLVSFLGRLNYGFDNKYLLTVSVRRDGSSVFGSDHKWGTFPSASAAWRISDEPFMGDQNVISDLKIRVGYGVTGNQQGLFPQNSLQLVGASGTVFFNGELITNFAVTQNANRDLRWETRKQTNVGLDFGFFENRLFGTFDVYSATTENLLFNYTVPQPPYPYPTIFANVGRLKNEGIELSLDYALISSSDLTVSIAGNVSLMRNEVLELSGSLNGIPLNTDYVSWGVNSYLIKGKPIGAFYILENAGKDENNEEIVVDRNDDEVVDQSNRSPDRYFAGSALPTYTYAFTPSVKYKNFDLSMVWRGSGGNKIFNRIKRDFGLFENLGKSNLLKSAVNTGLFTSEYSSDLWLEDGDYLRFQNLTVGYTIGGVNKYIKSLRISLTGNDLLLFTKYSGLDPELNLSGGNGSGFDAGAYPRTTSVSLGLNVVF